MSKAPQTPQSTDATDDHVIVEADEDHPVEVREGATPILTASLAPSLLRFGMPLVIAMSLQATFNLVDMYIVGKLPNATAALGALGLCDLIAMIGTIAGNGIANASVAIIARRDGAGDRQGVALGTAQSITVTLMLSLVFGVFGVFGSDFITGDLLGAKGAVQPLAADYMEVIVGGSFSILVLLQLVAILRAVGDSRTPMLLLIGSNVLNFFLSILMVYGPGPSPPEFAWLAPVADFFGIERGGVVGAAVSTVISRSLAIAWGLYALAKHKGGIRFTLKQLLPVAQEIKLLLKIAWPNSSQFLLRVAVITFFAAVIAHMFTTAEDPSTLTGFTICVRLDSLALFTGMGWGAAASTFVGQNMGAGNLRRAYAAGWWSAILNAILMVGVFLLYVTFADELVSLFDSTPKVVEAGSEYLTIVGASYPLFGIAVVLSQALTGAGATLASFILDAVVLVGLVIPITLGMMLFGDLVRTDVWWIIAGGNILAMLTFSAWYMKKDWLNKQVS